MPKPTIFPLPEDYFSGGTHLTDDFGLIKALNDFFSWSEEGLVKLNTTATTDPTANDDSTQGYVVESRWANVALGKEWVCLQDTPGAAIWKETTASGALGSEEIIKVSVGASVGTYSSTTSLAAGAVVKNVALIVTAAYDGAATIEATIAGSSPFTLLSTSENLPSLIDVYSWEPMHSLLVAEAGVARVVVGGAPTVGAAQLIVQYTTTFQS